MFESWLELEHRPFGAAPFAAHYFAAEGIEYARNSIHRCVERGTGPAVVIGPAGTGKSMLAMVLQHELCPLTPFALVSGGELHSRREMLQSLLYEFGLPFRGDQESELRLALLDFFTSRDASQLASVLVVDDAHYLSAELLHDLANLSGHARDGNWCVQLVLTGTIRLDELLATPSLASFQQRISGRSYLTNWTLAETTAYIHNQIAPLHEKWKQFPTFPDESYLKIYEITSGTPRLVNQLCEHILMTALVTEELTIQPEEVERAWYDLQQLPPPTDLAPTTTTSHAKSIGDEELIEFGELTDDDSVTATLYGLNEIQAKLEQLEVGVHSMAHDEEPGCETANLSGDWRTCSHSEHRPKLQPQSSNSATENWPKVTAENPFTEEFAEEVIVRDSANVPLVVLVPESRRHDSDSVKKANRDFSYDVRAEMSPTMTFVDASAGLNHNKHDQDLLVNCAPFVHAELDMVQWVGPTGDSVVRPTNRRYRNLFSRLSQGA